MTTSYPVVDQLIAVFRAHGHRHYGENVTEQQHGLQCATLAESAGEPPSIVLACLLHDLGHLLHHMGEDVADRGLDARHESIGAAWLDRHFPPEIVEPIRLHVDAKRYLCWKDPQYLAGLSEASRKSLALQGGPMSPGEAAEFEAGSHYQAAVQVRRYDDMGKVPGALTPELEHFRPLMQSFVRPT